MLSSFLESLGIGTPNQLKFESSLYQTLDPTTPWYEWIMYCECCESLQVPGQPHLGRYTKYRNYLKEVGVL
jgi:hypothetical protein